MKTTVVPAQITTVEDKVAGNLSFSQLMLMTLPIFVGGAIFALIPPMTKVNLVKILITSMLVVTCLALAIRIKGKIVALWLVIMLRYRVRPRYYLFNKNDIYLRSAPVKAKQTVKKTVVVKKRVTLPALPSLPEPALVQIESAITNPAAQFHFKATKRGLHVYIHEIK